jgi:SDR family mycofactocin-dependent oxidoreductase
MPRLDGQVALITGGARGQGRAHALRLAAEGASIVVCDVAGRCGQTIPYDLASAKDLAATARAVEDQGRRCLALEADVRDTEQMERVVKDALAEFGRIDILCANAGVYSFASVATLTDDQWAEVLDTNLTGAFKSIRAVLPHMIERKAGSIVATASMAGKAGFPNVGHYAASKWGIIGLIKTVALEAAPHGVRANVVCPTIVDTPMIRNDAYNRVFRPDLEAPTFEDALHAMAALSPMGAPYLRPDDISGTVAFLCSDDARYITGETVSVAAGWNANNAA